VVSKQDRAHFERIAAAEGERRALARRAAQTSNAAAAAGAPAWRTQDWADIENVLAAFAIERRAVDWAYVERWCAEWDIAERAVRARALQG
jgi:hypothetical protein